MTNRTATRVCATAGCPRLVSGQPRCDEHTTRIRQPDDQRPHSRARGYNERWRRTRAAYLRSHPWCEHEDFCEAGATDVHHLDGLGPLGPRGHDAANLQALCHSHHSTITGRMRAQAARQARTS